MTERTRKEINKDISDVNKEIQERTMIVGPIWARSIVSFEIEDGVDDVDDALSFDEWDKQFTAFQNGENAGEIVVTVQNVGCDGGARLTEEIFRKINHIKFDIMMNEQQELRVLRQERHQAEKIKEAEHQLEVVKQGNPCMNSCSPMQVIFN